jgi:hypothetical protein
MRELKYIILYIRILYLYNVLVSNCELLTHTHMLNMNTEAEFMNVQFR